MPQAIEDEELVSFIELIDYAATVNNFKMCNVSTSAYIRQQTSQQEARLLTLIQG